MVEEKEPTDWLFPEKEQQQAAQREKGITFAQQYLVFSGATADIRAARLLEHWTRTVRLQKVPPNATPQEYAYWNARREFVESIHEQIELANNGLKAQPRTT